MTNKDNKTIAAIATASGAGGIGVIRLSGPNAKDITERLTEKEITPRYAHFSRWKKRNGSLIDEGITLYFKAPSSFTGEDVVELQGHGGRQVLNTLLGEVLKLGAELAKPGEFSERAFLNGKKGLSEIEAVSDLIAANSDMEYRLALKNMTGGISKSLSSLRKDLIHFQSLLELELDFSEEDIDFVNRDELKELLLNIKNKVENLAESFLYGNAIKEGVSVLIIGNPNTGKSTLLNSLLSDERAIVSSEAGTTRDLITETLTINGILFRFIDTAGFRETENHIESIGINKAKNSLKDANIICYVYDKNTKIDDVLSILDYIDNRDSHLIMLENKVDVYGKDKEKTKRIKDFVFSKKPDQSTSFLSIAAKNDTKIPELKKEFINWVDSFSGRFDTILSNRRHYDALIQGREHLIEAIGGIINDIPIDLLAYNLSECSNKIGVITGEIDIDDDILESIFRNFCIGK